MKHWWTETAAPRLLNFFGSVPNFVHSRLSSEKISSLPKQPDAAVRIIDESLEVNPKDVENELDLAFSVYRSNMNSEEAKQILLEIVIHSTLLAERIKKLSDSNIADERVERTVLDWRGITRQLTSDDLIKCVNIILQSDPKLLTAEQLSNLELVLERSLYENGQYVSIDATDLRKRLLSDPDNTRKDSDDTEEGSARISARSD